MRKQIQLESNFN